MPRWLLWIVFILAVLLIGGTLAGLLFMPHAHAQEQTRKSQPGDFGNEHALYHPIYKKLKRKNADGTWSGCCNGQDCRSTKPLIDATPKQRSRGYDTQVYVDRKWCPVKLINHQISLTSEQILLVKSNPLYKNFFRTTHICADKSEFYDELERSVKEDKKLRVPPIEQWSCPIIYCIVDGRPKT